MYGTHDGHDKGKNKECAVHAYRNQRGTQPLEKKTDINGWVSPPFPLEPVLAQTSTVYSHVYTYMLTHLLFTHKRSLFSAPHRQPPPHIPSTPTGSLVTTLSPSARTPNTWSTSAPAPAQLSPETNPQPSPSCQSTPNSIGTPSTSA